MSHVIDKILSGGVKPVERPTEYRSFVDSGHRPQMGFAISCATGDMHGFLYHTLDNMQLQLRGSSEFLSFTHRSKAVTIQGEGLEVIFRAMMRHTLMEIAEPDGRPSVPGMPIITRMEITTVGISPAPAARLVK